MSLAGQNLHLVVPLVEQPKGHIETNAGPSRYLSDIQLLMAAIVNA